eukprot:jgi/Tetstr1/458235/TSEL_044723.t1
MFGARGQIDLIDYQSSEYKGYRFLLTYIDHGIKFCFCTPIPNKEQPSKIIGLSEEEAKEVIESTKKLLPACQMVTGRATHSPSNGGIERFNRTIEEYIAHWCDENKSPNCPLTKRSSRQRSRRDKSSSHKSRKT